VIVRYLSDNAPDEIRIWITASDSPGNIPDEVFLLEGTMPGRQPYRLPPTAYSIEGDVLHELDSLVLNVSAVAGVPPPYRLKIAQDLNSWGGEGSYLEFLLEIQHLIEQFGVEVAAGLLVGPITNAFVRLKELVQPSVSLLNRKEAESKARNRIAIRYPVAAAALVLTGDEHDAAAGKWSFVFQNGQERYEIELGFIRGIPSAAHIKRTVRSGQD
jgi:hypothetical protein